MSNNEDIIKNYDRSVVKITTHDGLNVGTGFIMTEDGIICTCYHVVGDLDTEEFYDNIQVYFHNKKQPINASILLKVDDNKPYADPENDIVFLQISKEDLDSLKNNGQELLSLSESVVFGHRFISRGFRKTDEFSHGLGTSGEIRIITNYKIDNDKSIPIVQLYATDVEGGMSGSPVLDLETNKVIGMIDRIYDNEEEKKDSNLVMAIPVESLVKVYQDLSNKNPGLVLLNQFLEHIGSKGNVKYKNFDDVYVPPKEYLQIQKALEEKRCVFITGTPEYGKTFTAVKLMWDKWKDSNKKINCHFPKKLEKINEVLQTIKNGNDDEKYSNSIIYIEDPTGQTESDYQLNTIFRNSIVGIIEHLPLLNSYLIVTMRENIYQKTKADLAAGEERRLEKYIQRLEIGSPSYDYESRKEILLRWGNQMKCAWLNNDRFLQIILNELENEKLPTPYNIYAFTLATGLNHDNYNIDNEDHLKKIIHKYSQRTAETFATNLRDIDESEGYKILYACFPFISDEYPKEYVERKFNQILDDVYPHEKDYNKYKFSAAVEYHQGTIIFSGELKFVHPSLSESLKYLLMRDSFPDQRIQNIFAKVLIYLANDLIHYETISHFILNNYEIIVNNEIKKILIKFIDSFDFKLEVIEEILLYFDKVDESIKTKALDLVKTDEQVASSILYFLGSSYNKLPPSSIDKLLELAKTDDKIVRTLVPLIFANFDKVEESIKTKALDLVKTDEEVAYSIGEFFWYLRNNFPLSAIDKLLELAKTDDKIVRTLVLLIFANFDKVDESIKTKVLDLVKTDEEVASHIGETLRSYLDNFPLSAIDKLLELAKTSRNIANGVEGNIRYYLDNFPLSAIDKLLELAKTSKNIENGILEFLPYSIDKLSPSLIDKLLELAKTDDKIVRTLVPLIFANFDKMEESIKTKALDLVKTDEEVAYSIGEFFWYLRNNFPLSAIDKLLELAKTDDKIVRTLVPLIFANFDKMEESIKTKAFDLVKTDEQVASSILNFLGFYYNKLSPSLIDKLLELAKTDDKIVRTLVPLIFANFDKVEESIKTKALDLVKTDEEVAYSIGEFLKSYPDKLPPSLIDNLLELAKTSRNIANGVEGNIRYYLDNFPLSAIDKLLELAKTDEIISHAIKKILWYSIDKLSPSLIDKLLELAKTDDKIVRTLVPLIFANFDKMEESIKTKALDLVKTDEEVAYSIGEFLKSYPDKLPPSLIDNLLELAKTDEIVAGRIANLFGDLAIIEKIQQPIPLANQILNTFSSYVNTNEDSASTCLSVIYVFFEKLELDLKNKLLLKLINSQFEEIIGLTILIIIGNYKIIDNNTLDLLLKNEHLANVLKRNKSLIDDTLMKKLN